MQDLICFTTVIAISCVCCDITSSPDYHNIVLVGTKVFRLECATNLDLPMTWWFTSAITNQPKEIYFGEYVIKQMQSRYTVDTSNQGHYTLVIPFVDEEHAGQYSCHDHDGDSEETVYVIVLDNELKRNKDINDEYYTYNLSFSGNLRPNLHWFGIDKLCYDNVADDAGHGFKQMSILLFKNTTEKYNNICTFQIDLSINEPKKKGCFSVQPLTLCPMQAPWRQLQTSTNFQKQYCFFLNLLENTSDTPTIEVDTTPTNYTDTSSTSPTTYVSHLAIILPVVGTIALLLTGCYFRKEISEFYDKTLRELTKVRSSQAESKAIARSNKENCTIIEPLKRSSPNNNKSDTCRPLIVS